MKNSQNVVGDFDEILSLLKSSHEEDMYNTNLKSQLSAQPEYKVGGRNLIRSINSRLRQTFFAPLVLATMFVASDAARAQDKPTELVIAGMGGQVQAAMEKYYAPFEKEYNVKLNWQSYGSSESVARTAATKDNPEFDIVWGDATSHDLGSQLGLWADIDKSIVTNWKYVLPNTTPPTKDMVPFGLGVVGIFYSDAEFKKRGWSPPKRWADMLKPEYCNLVGIPHPNSAAGIMTLLMLAGGDPAKVNEAIAKLAAFKDCIPQLEPTPAKLEEKIMIGEYLLGAHSAQRVIPLMNKGVPVKFLVPDDGPGIYLGTLSPVKNSAHPRLAQEFCNWVLRPDVQQKIVEELFFSPVTSTVKVPKELTDLGLPDQAQIAHLVLPSARVINENRRKWVRDLERAIAK